MGGKTAILIGATGLVGKQVLEKLLALPVYEKVIAVSRKPVAPHPKLQNLIVDFDKLADSLVNLHADEAFCCLGTTLKQAGSRAEFHKVDFGYNLEFAHAMRQNGCTHFLLVSALGASPKSLVFYSRVKGLLEKDIATLEFPRLSIFRPSLLLGERGENRLAENLVATFFPVVGLFLRGPLRTIKPIRGDQVASAMVAVANLPEPEVNPAVYFFDDMLAASAAFS